MQHEIPRLAPSDSNRSVPPDEMKTGVWKAQGLHLRYRFPPRDVWIVVAGLGRSCVAH
jgi:hypothetical protein